jgi:hypothetical protein
MRQLMENEVLCVNGASEVKPSETPVARPWNIEEKLKGVVIKPPILILPGPLPLPIQ